MDLRTRFLRALEDLRGRVDVRQLTDLVESGRINDALIFAETSYLVFASGVTAAFVRAGVDMSVIISDHLMDHVSFDMVNARAVASMRREQLRLVRDLSDDSRNALRTLMSDGIQRGTNPRTVARELRQYIGLTTPQAQAVVAYRRVLESSPKESLSRMLRDRRVDRAIRGGRALTKKQIDRMVEHYAQRQLALRAETIARTESLAVVHAGHREMLKQAVESDDLPEELIVREWTISVARVRPSHRYMGGQKRPGLDTPFTSGLGNHLLHPGDPRAPAKDRINCRCAVATRLL